jgi:hypothetical protein
VRSAIRACSGRATAPSTCKKNMPCGGGGIYRVAQAAEMCLLGFELFDRRQQVGNGAGEAVRPDHNQRLAWSDIAR